MKYFNRIKEIRLNRNLQQAKLASLIGVSVPSLQKYENGEIDPKSGVLTKIKYALDCTLDDLIGDNPSNEYLSGFEVTLIKNYRNLNYSGKEKLFGYVDDLLANDLNRTPDSHQKKVSGM